jgi:hypothetical protein
MTSLLAQPGKHRELLADLLKIPSTVHPYLAVPPAQSSRRGRRRSRLPRTDAHQSRNGVLTARRPVYRLRTHHRPPTSFAGARAEVRLRYRA